MRVHLKAVDEPATLSGREGDEPDPVRTGVEPRGLEVDTYHLGRTDLLGNRYQLVLGGYQVAAPSSVKPPVTVTSVTGITAPGAAMSSLDAHCRGSMLPDRLLRRGELVVVIAVIEVIGYRHVLASTDAPEVAVIAHLPHQLLDIVVGFAEGRSPPSDPTVYPACEGTPRPPASHGSCDTPPHPRRSSRWRWWSPTRGKLLLLLYVPPVT